MGTKLSFEGHRMEAGNILFESSERTFSLSRATHGSSVHGCWVSAYSHQNQKSPVYLSDCFK